MNITVTDARFASLHRLTVALSPSTTPVPLLKPRAQASVAATGAINTTTDPLIIGSKHNSGVSGDYFNGQLDDVRLYNRALTAAEIDQLVFLPIVLTVGAPTSGQFNFSFSGVNGHDYAIETSTDLMNWSSVLTNIPVGGMATFTNTNATDPRRFYRVRR